MVLFRIFVLLLHLFFRPGMASLLSHVRGFVIFAAMENKKQVYIGLDDAQVVESRRLHGTNLLTPPARESKWRAFIKKFGIR